MPSVVYGGPSNRYRIPREGEDIVLRKSFAQDVPDDVAEVLAETRGHVFEIDGELADPVGETPEPDPSPLSELTVEQLHELASEHDLDVKSDAHKAEIVAELEAAGVNAPDA